MLVDFLHHLIGRVRTRDRQHFGVNGLDEVFAAIIDSGTQTAGHDHTTVFIQGFRNGVQAFLDRLIDEATGVDDHQISTLKGFAGLITFSTQSGENQLGVGQSFWAT